VGVGRWGALPYLESVPPALTFSTSNLYGPTRPAEASRSSAPSRVHVLAAGSRSPSTVAARVDSRASSNCGLKRYEVPANVGPSASGQCEPGLDL
jgi:hypothetical protein